MAIKILTRTLGKIVEQDGAFVVRIRGLEPRKFTNKKDADAYLDKKAPKRYIAGLWANGKLTWKSFSRKKDAEDYLHRRNTEIVDGVYKPISREKSKATFKQYAEIWRNKYLIAEEGLKASTIAVRQYCLDKHLILRFGGFALRAITPDQITDFRADLLKAGNSIGHANRLVNMLSTVFDDAINDGYLKMSPMPRSRREKKDRGKKSDREKARALTYEQAQKFLEQCEADEKEGREANPDLKVIILLGLLAGLRRGEIFALDFSDIDWDKDLIHVRRNLVWLYGKHHRLVAGQPKYVIYAPKTKNSIRDIDLSPKLKDALWTRYMEMQMQGKTGLIFQSQNGSVQKKDGTYEVRLRAQETQTFATEEAARKYLDTNKTPVDPKNIEERWFKAAVEQILEKADKDEDEETYEAFDGLTMHHLRHTFGSWKIAQGEDVVYVSKQMGHSQPSVTYNVYAHLIDKRRPQAAALTDEKLFGRASTASEQTK